MSNKSGHAVWRLLMNHEQLCMRKYAYITYIFFVHCQASSKLTYGSGNVIVLVTAEPCSWNLADSTLDQVTSGMRRTTPVTLNKKKRKPGWYFAILREFVACAASSDLFDRPPLQSWRAGHRYNSEGSPFLVECDKTWPCPSSLPVWLFPSKALCVCRFGILCWHEFRMLIL